MNATWLRPFLRLKVTLKLPDRVSSYSILRASSSFLMRASGAAFCSGGAVGSGVGAVCAFAA